MRALMLLVGALIMVAPAHAGSLDETLFEIEYSIAVVGPDCGVIGEADAKRLRMAVFAKYGQGSAATRGLPRIPRGRLLAIQATVDQRPTTGFSCLMAWRSGFELLGEFPPPGQPRRTYSGAAWYQPYTHSRHRADVVAAMSAARCGLVTPEEAAALIARSASLPRVQYYLRIGEIVDAHREGASRAETAGIPCPVVDEMLTEVERFIAEDETGWVESD